MNTPLYYLLGAAIGTSCIVFGLALQNFFVEVPHISPRIRLFQDGSVVLALTHAGAVLYLGPASDAHAVAGILLFTLGSAVFLGVIEAARRVALPRAFIHMLPDRLVTSGPYHLMRHPVYFAYTVFWAACPLTTWNAWLLPAGLVSVALYVVAARREEAMWLESERAAAYRHYMARTGFFWPKWPV